MTKAQMPKLMRQRGELRRWVMITVDMHSITRCFFFVCRTAYDSDQARLQVALINRVPLDVLFLEQGRKRLQLRFVESAAREETLYVFRQRLTFSIHFVVNEG